MKNLSTLDMVALILVIIGGLNWGLHGFFDYNLVNSIFGEGSFLTKLIYDLVGLSALYLVFTAMNFGKK